ncbi:hypothetical protein Tco_0843950 [Tanacetum coccineum]
MKAVTQDIAYVMDWKTLKKMMTEKYCPMGEIKKLEIELWNLKVKGTDVASYTLLSQDLLHLVSNLQSKNILEMSSFGLVAGTIGAIVQEHRLRCTMPNARDVDHHDTSIYIPLYHRTGGFTGNESDIYQSLVYRLFHEGRIMLPDFLEDEPNLRPTSGAHEVSRCCPLTNRCHLWTAPASTGHSEMIQFSSLFHITTQSSLSTLSSAALLFIPPVDRREDTPEADLPPRKRLCLSAPVPRYEVGESSTTAPRPMGLSTLWMPMLDDKEPRRSAMALGMFRQTQIYQRVDILAGDRQFHYETARLLDQEALVSREAWAHSVGLSSAALRARGQTHADDREGAASTTVGLVFSFLVSNNHNNMPPRRSSATARAAAATATPMTAAAIKQLIEARVSAALANHDTLRNSINGHGDGSLNSSTRTRGSTRTPRECTYKDFLNCQPLTFKGTEGVVVLAQWFERMETVVTNLGTAMH